MVVALPSGRRSVLLLRLRRRVFPLLLRALNQEVHHRLALIGIDFTVVVFVESIQKQLRRSGAEIRYLGGTIKRDGNEREGHFVGSLFAELHFLRRVAGVVWIGGRVV